MKIYDAHNHPDWHGHDLEAFIANMDKYNIEKCWILSWESPLNEGNVAYAGVTTGGIFGEKKWIPFNLCLRYKEAYPDRFVLGYGPDPRDPAACHNLVAANKIYHAQVCGEIKYRMTYDDPDCLCLFRTAGDLGMPVTLHFDYNYRQRCEDPRSEWYGGDINALERALQACPDTKFLGHAPGFWIHISNDDLWKTRPYAKDMPVIPGGRIVELLRKYPNLYCDMSAGSGCGALSRDKEFGKQFILEFQDRILYARDCFDNRHQELLNSLDLPEDVLEKIYSRNAAKLIGEQ